MSTLFPVLFSALTPIALTSVYVALRAWLPGGRQGNLHMSALFGAAMWLAMMSSVHHGQFTIADMRGAILVLAFLFGGPIPAVVALAVGVVTRTWIGGPSAPIGVAVLATIFVGIFFLARWRTRLAPEPGAVSARALATMGAWASLNQGIALWVAKVHGPLLVAMPLSQFCVTMIAGGMLILIQQKTNLGRKLNEQEDLVRTLLVRDRASGLLNRTGFWLELDGALRRLSGTDDKIVVLLISIRRLHNVSVTLGPRLSESLLTEAARRLDAVVKNPALARFDDGTFGLFVMADRLDETVALVDKVFAAFRRPFHSHGHDLHLSLNIGISSSSGDRDSIETLISHGNQALARSVMLGENRLQVYDEHIVVQAVRPMKLEVELRRAVETGSELLLRYQPKVHLDTGKLHGVEALCNWDSPALGKVAPDEFIAVAETSGLIVPLGDWVLRETCRQLVEWRRLGFAPPVTSVNLSAKQLLDDDFPERSLRCVLGHDLDPSQIEFELTESSVMTDPILSINVLNRIKALGFPLSLDDFGSGASNIGHLKALPFDCIKIDKSVIDDLGASDDAEIVCKAIYGLGRAMHLDMVAEGIETEAQRNQLREIGFTLGQGFYFSPALSADELAAGWLARGYRSQDAESAL